MKNENQLAALAFALSIGSAASAQVTPHITDFQMRLDADNRIETGAFTEQGELVWGDRVLPTVLGATGDVNFTGDPGFENEPGTFPVGYGLGLTIRAALREWDGQDFDQVATQPLILVKFFSQVPTPAVDTPTPAFSFGAANGDGYFHHHVGYAFDASDAVEGVFLLELELWSGDAGNVVSDPLFILFAQGGAAVAELDAAEEWVELNRIGGDACVADLAEPTGVLDLADIDAFITGFASGDPAADIAGPFGVLDLADIDSFITSFQSGCP